MKSILIVLLVCTFFVACKEEYKNISPADFNKRIRTDTHIKTPTDLIFAYDTTLASRIHSNEVSLNISSRSIENDEIEITAIINILDDDELKAEKYTLITEHANNSWKVLEIRYNWKCFEGYGHTNWGIKK